MRNQLSPSSVRPPPLTPTVTNTVTKGACDSDAAPEDTRVQHKQRRTTGRASVAVDHKPAVGGTKASATPAKRTELGASERRALLALLDSAKSRARRPKLCCASCSCSLDDRRGWFYDRGTTEVFGLDDPFDDLNADRERLAAQAEQRAAEELFGPESADEALPAQGPGLPRGGPDPAGATPRANEDEEEEETAPARVHLDPGKPTQKEVEAHRDPSHLPYRLWCPECVAGRGTGEQHRVRPDERRIPVFGFDYLLVKKDGRFLSREESKESDTILLKVLVAKDGHSKAIFAHAVRHKGVSESRYAVDCLVQDLRWLGYSHVSLKGDNEPAILALLK